MYLSKIIENKTQVNSSLKNSGGGKAKGLQFLCDNRFRVPPFFVLSWDELSKIFSLESSEMMNDDLSDEIKISFYSARVIENINSTLLPKAFVLKVQNQCEQLFGTNYKLSVRSSAIAEDTDASSFAGLYSTFLYVTSEDLECRIKQCFASGWNPNALKYMLMRHGKIAPPRMSVIVQRMVNPVCSGVMFTRDANGNMNNVVISAGYGVGEGIVAGKVDTDTFYIDRLNGNTQQDIVQKRSALVYDGFSESKLKEIPVDSVLGQKPVLDKDQLLKLVEQGIKAEEKWGKTLDIEFAIDENGELFLLQARPITTIHFENVKILDNTNISESYPGVTLPLSISFARNNYYHVFKGTAHAVGIHTNDFPEMESVLSNLIGHAGGRVYYRLDNWYRIMALIIPSRKGIRNWESSVGLKHGSMELTRVSFYQRLRSIVKLIWFFFNHRKWSRRFFESFAENYRKLKDYSVNGKSAKEIYSFYEAVSHSLFSNWHPTLINDLIAFKSFGALKSIVKSLGFKDEENIANDLLCGTDGVESELPLKSLLELTEMVRNDKPQFDVFISKSNEEIYELIIKDNSTLFNKKFSTHLNLYGDRTTAELKLETKSLRDEPQKFIEMIRNHLETGYSSNDIKQRQQEIRTNAEKKVFARFSFVSPKKLYFNQILSLTRSTIRNRENMRFCRTRSYGAVKDLFLAIGQEMQKAGTLSQPNDIHFLELEQVENFCKNDVHTTLTGFVEDQKSVYRTYEDLKLPDRIVYQGEKPPIQQSTIVLPNAVNELLGVVVSKGEVTAKALVIDNPKVNLNAKGAILVTKITDPGWIFLMAQASGLITEKGSLLSHTAIVGRELGIPTIVGVANATEIIKSGETIYMDGAKGIVRRNDSKSC